MRYDWIVLGAGAGGLVVAIGGAKAGKKVLLVEKHLFGGDCTNYGCIPSKSLIASAKIAHAISFAKGYGIESSAEWKADEALNRVRKIVEEVQSHEDQQALEKMRIHCIKGEASFIDSHHINITKKDQTEIQVFGSQIIIATGGRPHPPSIPGLQDVPYLTNETIFSLKTIPKHLLIVGGGPIGCELAQAFARLGSQVFLFHRREHLLVKEELFAQEIIENVFKQESIQLNTQANIKKISHDGSIFQIQTENQTQEGEALLIATGRRPNTESLKLQNTNIFYDEKGIKTDAYGRCSDSHIWAIGDVVGPPFFTHRSEHHARVVLRNLLLPFWKKKQKKSMPRTTFTDPEVASVGFSVNEAQKKFGKNATEIYTLPFTEVDRAITDSKAEGTIQIVTKKWSSKILGATIVGPAAGEMLAILSLCIQEKIPLRRLSHVIYSYPTYSLAIRKISDLWLTKTLIPAIKKW